MSKKVYDCVHSIIDIHAYISEAREEMDELVKLKKLGKKEAHKEFKKRSMWLADVTCRHARNAFGVYECVPERFYKRVCGNTDKIIDALIKNKKLDEAKKLAVDIEKASINEFVKRIKTWK